MIPIKYDSSECFPRPNYQDGKSIYVFLTNKIQEPKCFLSKNLGKTKLEKLKIIGK